MFQFFVALDLGILPFIFDFSMHLVPVYEPFYYVILHKIVLCKFLTNLRAFVTCTCIELIRNERFQAHKRLDHYAKLRKGGKR